MGNPVIKTVPAIHEETTTSVPSGTTTSAPVTMVQSGGGSGGSYSGASPVAGSSTSGSVPAPLEKNAPATPYTPSQESSTPENVTDPGSSATSHASTSSSDTQGLPVEPPLTKAPLMVWIMVCALFCAGIIIRSGKSP